MLTSVLPARLRSNYALAAAVFLAVPHVVAKTERCAEIAVRYFAGNRLQNACRPRTTFAFVPSSESNASLHRLRKRWDVIFVISWPPYPKSHSGGGAIHFDGITPVYRDTKLYCYLKCASALPRSSTAISVSIAQLVTIFRKVLAVPLLHARVSFFGAHSGLMTIITSS